MPSKVRRIDFYPDEYIAGIGCKMNAEAQGVYWMICALVSSHGGEIDNDPKHIGRLVCLGSSKTRRIISELIESGKIIENGTKLSQKRAENEVKKALKRIEIAANNGRNGGRPPNKNNNLKKASGLSGEKLTTNHQPPTTNLKEKIDKKETKLTPNTNHYKIGAGEKYTQDEVNWLAEGFNDYAPTRKPAYKDLNRAFGTWLRSEISHRNIDQRRKSLGNQPGIQGFADLASEVVSDLERQRGDNSPDEIHGGRGFNGGNGRGAYVDGTSGPENTGAGAIQVSGPNETTGAGQPEHEISDSFVFGATDSDSR
jgi:hypothetical protein